MTIDRATQSAQRQHALKLHRSGQTELAETAYRRLLAEDPADAESRDLLGVLLGQQARYLEALESHLEAVRLDPRNGRFHANLGTTFVSLGRMQEAADAFSVACDLDTPSAELHVDRGMALASLGRHQDAMEAFHTGISIDPACFAAWIGRGQSEQALGKTEEALGSFRHAAELQPRGAVAHANCGAVLSELDRHAAAVESYRVAVECDPQSIEIRLNLASALLVSGSVEDAESVYRTVAALAPYRPEAYAGIAAAGYARGEYAGSVAFLEKALKLGSDDPTVLCNLGRIKVETGDLAGAEALYRRALAACPMHGPAWIGLSETRTFLPDDIDLRTMSGHLRDPLLNPRARVQIGFAYAKACEDAGDYAVAGSSLMETNALARSMISYDVADDERRLLRIAESVDSQLIARWQTAGSASVRPLFIVGMPRSGTTLLEQMLSIHPMVHGAGELADYPRLVRSMLTSDYPQHLSEVSPDSIGGAGRAYLRALERIDSDARHVIDKLPANFEYVGLIAAMYPGAMILHCERDALDTCWSCFQRPFTDGNLWSYDLAETARYYRGYQQLMDHWNRILPGRIHSIRYESLVARPEEQLREVFDKLGLPWDALCLQFHSSRRPVKTASASQVRRPLYTTAIGRSRHYGSLLDPLVAALAGNTGAS